MSAVSQNEGARPVLALDLGGTKILAVLVSRDGHIIDSERRPTLATEGPPRVIERLFGAVDSLLERGGLDLSQLDSISIAAAGAINYEEGIVTLSPNLPGWRNIPLRDMVRERYGIEVFLMRDANAAALGEQRYGAGRGAHHLIYLTVSTGIGGGIIIDGKGYIGHSGGAGEIGHITIDVNGPVCSCGNKGCLEMLASGAAVAREARRRITAGERSALTEMVSSNIEAITAEYVGAAARANDRLAQDVIAQAANYLGVGLVNIVNIFNPELVIIGGGLAKLGDLLLEPARQVVMARAFPMAAQAVRIVPAALGDDAGVLGAALFARSRGEPPK
ncbi:MAG: ROK family protein [Chloroflexi bacterium]|nr:ROK family protein [Chloroflexota bacterium]